MDENDISVWKSIYAVCLYKCTLLNMDMVLGPLYHARHMVSSRLSLAVFWLPDSDEIIVAIPLQCVGQMKMISMGQNWAFTHLFGLQGHPTKAVLLSRDLTALI